MEWVIVAATVAVGSCLGVLVQRRSARRHASAGTAECALRVVDGEHPPLTATWRHGVADPSPGSLRFRPGGPLGARWPRGTAFDIELTTVRSAVRSRPGLRQAWSIDPGLDVVTVTTPTATLELAARPPDLDRVIDAVGT